MACTYSPSLTLCIFKECLIKATLVSKLHLLEIYLLLLGSVEFSVLEKKKPPTLYFSDTDFFFNVFFSHLSYECCLVYLKDGVNCQGLC